MGWKGRNEGSEEGRDTERKELKREVVRRNVGKGGREKKIEKSRKCIRGTRNRERNSVWRGMIMERRGK